MSKYGWTLWASIQDGVSDIDFDFWEWGIEKYERAVVEFDGPDFGRLLEDVHRRRLEIPKPGSGTVTSSVTVPDPGFNIA